MNSLGNKVEKSIRRGTGVILNLEFRAYVHLHGIEIKDAPFIEVHVISADRMRVEVPAIHHDRSDQNDSDRVAIKFGNIDDRTSRVATPTLTRDGVNDLLLRIDCRRGREQQDG